MRGLIFRAFASIQVPQLAARHPMFAGLSSPACRRRWSHCTRWGPNRMTLSLFAFFCRGCERSGRAAPKRARRARQGLAALAAALFVLGCVAQASPALAEKAALFEQGEPQGKHFAGTVTWRLEKEPASARHPAAVAIRADVAIPERHITATWVLRRNTDRSLPATHTIDIMFKFPPGFPGHGIAKLPGVTMKPTEAARGTPLAAVSAKVTPDFFLIGLSAAQGDAALNRDILRDGKWIDILLVYADDARAILTLEKGPSGERVFDQALAAWKK